MRPEDHILFICARQDFGSAHLQKLSNLCQAQDIHWDMVLETAKQHAVAPLVYTNLIKYPTAELGIPQSILEKFKLLYLSNVIRKRKTAEIAERLFELFAERSIDVMLVKGAALNFSHVYDQPWYTVSKDVDLVIRPKREDMSEDDRREIITVIEKINHQRVHFKEHIEYDFFEHHDVTMNNVIPVNSERIWQDAPSIRIGDHNVFVMSPEDLLISVAINSCRKRYFRLKSILDIAEIIQKYPDLDWGNLSSKAHEYQCNDIVYTAFLVTQKTLGCDMPEGFLNDLRVNPVRAYLIHRIVEILYQRAALIDFIVPPSGRVLGRELSWSLVLTYTTYRWDQIGRKVLEVIRAWRS